MSSDDASEVTPVNPFGKELIFVVQLISVNINHCEPKLSCI